MKKFVVDTHTHTIVSGHAYSTLMENIKEASRKGLRVLGATDHGPQMSGAPKASYFSNMRLVPRIVEGVTILKGCEANIVDHNGNLDLPQWALERMDLIIASFHESCIKPGTRDENTNTLIKVMENPYVDIIGHPGNPAFPINEELFVKQAKENNVLIELNNSSLGVSREGSAPNCIKIALLCKIYGVKIVCGTDSHICCTIGEFDKVRPILEAIDMPEELIINTDECKIIKYLKEKKKLKDVTID